MILILCFVFSVVSTENILQFLFQVEKRNYSRLCTVACDQKIELLKERTRKKWKTTATKITWMYVTRTDKNVANNHYKIVIN